MMPQMTESRGARRSGARRSGAIGAVLLGLAVCQTSSWAETRLVDERFGVIMFLPEWDGGGIPKIKEIGAGIVRGGCSWDALEPSRGQFQWDCSDDWVGKAGQNQLRLYFGIGCTPGWANGGQGCNVMPTTWRDWYELVAAFITRYSSANVVLGFYNEPNLNGIDPENACRLFSVASEARNSVNPRFIIGGPETSWHAAIRSSYYNTAIDCMLPFMSSQDIVAVHYYLDAPVDMLGYTDVVNATAKGHGVWLTEAGPSGYDSVDVYRQAYAYATMLSQFIDSGRSWLTHILFYRLWDGMPCCTGAILNADYTNKPAARTYHSRVHGLSGAGARDTLAPGSTLAPGQAIDSANGRYQVLYQSDGDLVLYENSTGKTLWASHTAGRSPGQAIMERGGNFVIYDANGNQLWVSQTDANPGAFAVVQDDGIFTVNRLDSYPLWWTCCHVGVTYDPRMITKD